MEDRTQYSKEQQVRIADVLHTIRNSLRGQSGIPLADDGAQMKMLERCVIFLIAYSNFHDKSTERPGSSARASRISRWVRDLLDFEIQELPRYVMHAYEEGIVLGDADRILFAAIAQAAEQGVPEGALDVLELAAIIDQRRRDEIKAMPKDAGKMS